MDDIEIISSGESWVENIHMYPEDLSLTQLFKMAHDRSGYLEEHFTKYIDNSEDTNYFKYDTRELSEEFASEASDKAQSILTNRIENNLKNLDDAAFKSMSYDECDKLITDLSTDFTNLTEARANILMDALPESWFLLNDKLRESEHLQRQALNFHPEIFELCNKELRADMQIATEIFKQDPHQVRYASDEIRNDLNIALVCAKADPSSIHLCGKIPRDLFISAGGGKSGLNVLTKAVEAEKLHSKLNASCSPKNEPQKPRIKI
ncbi:DUF4116 domain-containing protein [Variovorax sp. RB3P1]|uniref:DUF4116 domain-containing protein n=1 Tax=Variovorax sp. RB3P1 TaxID=3443732 RepID=UPI003F4605EF